jgi:hypothetical protein
LQGLSGIADESWEALSHALPRLCLSQQPARILIDDEQTENSRAESHAGLKPSMNPGQ